MPTPKKTKRQRKKNRRIKLRGNLEIFYSLLASGFFIFGFLIISYFILPNSPYTSTIHSGANWLSSRQNDSGQFNYEYDPWKDTESDDDNIVRQAGTAYIMGDLFRQYKNGQYLTSVIHSLEYLNTQTQYVTQPETELAYLNGENNQYKTGAVALAYLACLHSRDTALWNTDLERQCQGYKNLLDYLERPEGGFSKRYHPFFAIDNAMYLEHSPYYDSEAWLALAWEYKTNPTAKLKQRLEKHFNYFQQTYTEKINAGRNGSTEANNDLAGFYLWGMRSLNQLDQIFKNPHYAEFAYLYTDYIIELKKLDQSNELPLSQINNCSFLEGVISAYAIAHRANDTTVMERWQPIIEINLSRLAGFQVDQDYTLRTIRDEHYTEISLPNPDKASGGFLNSLKQGQQQMRIDYTQHCLGAFALAEEYFY